MRYYVLFLIFVGMMLLFRLLCGAVALWLARNDPQRQQQLFDTALKLLTRRPWVIVFPLPKPRQQQSRRQAIPAGTRSIADKSCDRAA
jgi:hypothetical protein